MQKISYRLRSFMIGRYGTDQLNIALLVLGLLVSLLFSFFGLGWFTYLAYLPYLLMLFRVFSRNIQARRKENAAFLRVWNPVAGWFRLRVEVFRNRKQYKYFKCPKCKLNLRVPRGKGKIQVTCRRCNDRFIKKS